MTICPTYLHYSGERLLDLELEHIASPQSVELNARRIAVDANNAPIVAAHVRETERRQHLDDRTKHAWQSRPAGGLCTHWRRAPGSPRRPKASPRPAGLVPAQGSSVRRNAESLLRP